MRARYPHAMSENRNDRAGALRWTSAGFHLGVRLALPVVPGMVAFGLAVGATAAGKGLTFIDSLLMNVLVYAGMSQLVALDVWPQQITPAALAGLALICLTVNARMLLMGASLRPWLGALPARSMYPALHILADPSWLITMRYRAEGGADPGVFLGSSVALALAWIAAGAVGHLGGTLIADPRPLAVDLVMPIFFAVMLIPLWRGARRAVAWIVAGAVALAVQHVVGGPWFLIAGAVAGSVAGGYLDDQS
jgi:4-azaleucine resistance transporter AzlC